MDPSNIDVYLSKITKREEYAKVIIYVTNTSCASFVSNKSYNWKFTYHENFAQVDWTEVLILLDDPEFYIGDIRALKTLLNFYHVATRGQVMPLEPFVSPNWKNGAAQISLLRHVYLAISMNITDFQLPETSFAPILTPEIVNETTQNLSTRQIANSNWIKSIWNAQVLMKILMFRAQWIPPNREDDAALSRILSTNTPNNQGNHGKFDMVEEAAHLPFISAAVAREEAKWMLDWASRQATELVTIGLIQLKHPWSPLHTDVVSKLLTLFLIGHSSSSFVLTRAWNVLCGKGSFEAEGNVLIDTMIDVWRKDMNRCGRILDIVVDVKAINPMMETKRYPFTLDIASLAARREYLNLLKWLEDRFNVEGDSFITAIVSFVRMKLLHLASMKASVTPTSPGVNQSIALADEVLARYLKFIHSHTSSMTKEVISLYMELQSLVVKLVPQFANLVGGDSIKSAGSQSSQSGSVINSGGPVVNEGVKFPPDIEEKANSYYERIYTGELSVPAVVSLLYSLQNGPSSSPYTKQIFQCMLQNLFDEYRFLPKYPDKELILTGNLFGTIVQEGFAQDVALGIALRMVLEAVKKPTGSKMYRFGLVALERFKGRLREWPQYCAHLRQVKHLKDGLPDLMDYLDSMEEKGIVESAVIPTHTSKEHEVDHIDTKKPVVTHSIAPAIVQHVDVPIATPDDATLNRILFILNNISFSNIEEKISEFRTLLIGEEGSTSPEKGPYFQWFSHYLVQSRLATEPNFHSLYLSLLKHLGLPKLEKVLFAETMKRVSELMKSDKILTNPNERSSLKNLGSWVGAMTLAREKPIKFRDLAVKELLIEGYQNERLIATIPFVCKVLEQTKESKVFRPPNPWLMAVLRLLVELYTYAELKLTLKFEIEVMCKNLSIELKDIEPTNILRLAPRDDEEGEMENGYEYPDYNQDGEGNNMDDPNRIHAFANQHAHMSQPYADHHGASYGHEAHQLASVVAGQNLAHIQVLFDEAGNISSIPNLAAYISFQSNPAIFLQHPHLKKIVLLATEQAIREILMPVMDRSISIAGVATREIILKDFSSEMHEERMRRAAGAMGSYLAGSLASVTSREPFRISMTTHLRTLFAQQGIHESVIDALVQSSVNDNTDLGCAIVEKSAMEKSILEINEVLNPAYLARRRQRERGIPWTDVPQYPNSPFAALIPDVLKLKPGNPRQMRVYEDFIRQGRLISVPAPVIPSNRVEPEPSPPANPYQQIHEKFTFMLMELDKSITKCTTPLLSSLPGNHEIILLVRQLNTAASQLFVRDDLALWFSQKLVRLLFNCEVALGIEIYIILLERICEISKRVARELTMWLLFSDDEKKFNVRVTALLIQSGLLNILELDTYLAKQIESGRNVVVEFGARLVHKCLCVEPPIVTYTEVYYSLDALAKLLHRKRLPESLDDIVKEMSKKAPGLFFPAKDSEYISLRDELIFFFEEWVKLVQANPGQAKVDDFVAKFQSRNIFDDEDNFSLFIRYAAEITNDTYSKLKNTPNGGVLGFQVADAFAKLVVLLITKFPVQNNQSAVLTGAVRVDRFSRTLSIFSLVMIHLHEIRREHFDQRPFFRFFSSLFSELTDSSDANLIAILPALLTAIANTLHVLRPLFMPGFIFAWLQLVSHARFMPKLLQLPNQQGWQVFERLLVDLFQFLAPFLRHGEMSECVRVFYKGTLRVLLILLHDFPEFLCHFHFSFCDVISPTCIQLRNLILSAFPRTMRLPDPFTPNLKVDMLPETNRSPVILSDYTSILKREGLSAGIDSYLKSRSPSTFPSELKNRLFLPEADHYSAGTKYNVPLINAVVLYVGTESIKLIQSKSTISQALPSSSESSSQAIIQSPSMDICQELLADFDTEGRYHLLNAITNHLRYPNSHTHYFSCALLYLFVEAGTDEIKEQITRVLLERLIVNRPHPWGLLITFIELMKNKRYAFWDHAFTRCAPDIERLFESVARSCLIPTAAERTAERV